MTGLTEDQIEPLCQRLYEAARDDKEDEIRAIGLQLLSGFLVDINRIAWFVERLATAGEDKS